MNTAIVITHNILVNAGWDVSVVNAADIPQPIEDFNYALVFEDVVFRGPAHSKAAMVGRTNRRPPQDIYDLFAKFLADAGLLKAKRAWDHNGKDFVSWRNKDTTVIVDMEFDPRVPVEGKPAYYAGTVQACVFNEAPLRYQRKFRSVLAKYAANVKNTVGVINPTEHYRQRAKDAQQHKHLKADPNVVTEEVVETDVPASSMGQTISSEALNIILMMRQGYGRIKIN